MTYLWVALGGALGSVLRYWCSGLIAHSIGEIFPWGTLVINMVGSFVIGFVAVITGPDGRVMVASDARIFVTVGICGGFTTFSSFSLQTLNLARDGEMVYAGLNVLLSVVLCLVSVWLGYMVASALNQLKGA
ncbi:MAG: fluoride efflux transporter CrcB [Alphaproteobacteria bacterium]|nr:fluoride efflux transporter CrcB [Alphaproteobacteria bacterium]